MNPIKNSRIRTLMTDIFFEVLGSILLAAATYIVIGGIIFRDLEGIVYGLVINYLLSIVVDKVIHDAITITFSLPVLFICVRLG